MVRDLNHSGRKRSDTIAKCTVEPPTALPLLLLPISNGFSPSTMRSSVQYSFVCSVSSDAKSSNGRKYGPASSATTENPCSASLHANVPPPAPVPTIAKSTASPWGYSRIGTHAPGRKTSGAQPRRARGCCMGSSDMAIDPANRGVVAIRGFGGLPGIALVEVEADIAARTCGATPADLAPSGRMRVIGEHDVVRHTLL